VSLDALAEAYPDVPRVAWAASLPATPEQAVEQAEQTRRLAAAIAALPPALARAVTLHYLEGQSYAEVAAALAVPVSTVKGRLFKSRARLRRALDPDGRPPRRSRTPAAPRSRKEARAVTATTESFATELVPVQVERIYQAGQAPTPDRVRSTLHHLFVSGAPDGAAPAPDLLPVAEQLLACVAAPDLALRAAPRAILLAEEAGRAPSPSWSGRRRGRRWRCTSRGTRRRGRWATT
jgi:hypothetical protein